MTSLFDDDEDDDALDREAAWRAADELHREAHDRWPIAFCTKPSCAALKDALSWDWRESGVGVLR